MIGVLLALYPAHWRRRYGDEFRAVLESRPLGPFDVADVLLGAFDARSRALRVTGQPENDGGHLTMLRIGGVAAIVGGALWATGFIGGNLFRESVSFWFGLLALGNVAILVALVGLSAFQAHRDARLAWAAFAIPGLGTVVSIIGVFGLATTPSDDPFVLGWSAWSVWMLGIVSTILGSILFGIATLQAEVLSRRAAAALATSSAVFLVIGLLGIGSPVYGAVAQAVIAASIVAFGTSWAWLGTSALRRGPIRAIAPA